MYLIMYVHIFEKEEIMPVIYFLLFFFFGNRISTIWNLFITPGLHMDCTCRDFLSFFSLSPTLIS